MNAANEPSDGLLHLLVDRLMESAEVIVGTNVAPLVDWEDATRMAREPALALCRGLVGWMGPGGDLAFLEMYALATGQVPNFFMTTLVPEYRLSMAGQPWDGHGNGDPATRGKSDRELQKVVAYFSRGKFKVNYSKHKDELYRKKLDKQLAFMEEDGLLQILYTMDLPPLIVLRDADGDSVTAMAWRVTPVFEYRTDLMGELASPWERPLAFPDRLYEPPQVTP